MKEKERRLKLAHEICQDYPHGCVGCEFYGSCGIEILAAERLKDRPRRHENVFCRLFRRQKIKGLTR